MSSSSRSSKSLPAEVVEVSDLGSAAKKELVMDMSQRFEISSIHHATPLHDAELLTNDNGLAHIKLGDQLYILRITRAGKLILTK